MQLFQSLSACFGNGTAGTPRYGGCGWNELGPIVNELLRNLILVGIFIAIVMIMYAGYILVNGQGSPESRSRVKKMFMGIAIGLFLVVGAYYIVEFVLDTLGIKSEYRRDSLPTRTN